MSSNPHLLPDPKAFFRDLGGLHDARIAAFKWDRPRRTVSILVDDIHSNFLGLPEYRGARPAKLFLREVDQLELCVEIAAEELAVYDVEVSDSADDGTRQVLIRWSPGGLLRCRCKEIVVDYEVDPVPDPVLPPPFPPR
jgi:hypothetical protein